MLIPKELESKILTELTAALSAGISADELARQCTLTGSWQPSASGLVKWIAAETATPVHVHVAVGTALPRTFTSGDVDFNVNISIFIRTDLDTTGELQLAYAEKIENLLRGWQAETYQQALTTLSLPDVFYVGDIQGQSGNSPTLQDNIVSISWPLVIGGSYA